jgi:hypothetical protein
LTVVAKYEDAPVTGVPLSYDDPTNIFEIESEDQDLIGRTKQYSLEAEFSDYPSSSTSAATAAVEANITFNDPCLEPFIFSGNTQANTDPNKYTDTVIDWTFIKHTISPSYCVIMYQCSDPILRVDGKINENLTCADLGFDLIYEDVPQLTDGKIQFKASETDYTSGTYPPG